MIRVNERVDLTADPNLEIVTQSTSLLSTSNNTFPGESLGKSDIIIQISGVPDDLLQVAAAGLPA